MRRISRTIVLCASIYYALAMNAQKWTTHFAYNNVTQIALAPGVVYALSDGNLFSVDKRSEKIRIYNRQSGLHSTGITCIHFDGEGSQLIIAYANGKIDLLSSSGVRYIGDLYDKDMTQRKNIYNVTIFGRTAYLATHYGIQTFNLRENTLVDSYWLRPNGEETPVKDVLLRNDSIYAFTDDSLYCASLKANLVDYTQWKREKKGRVQPSSDKGTHYKDGTTEWYAGNDEGIIRYSLEGRITYKPQGPLSNNPYRMTTFGNELWVVPGGRWAVQYYKPGMVMHYTGSKWVNIEASTIQEKTKNQALDFMNVAVDPQDKNHYFVTSYGTGLYEFDHDTLVRQYLPGEDNTLSPAASNPKDYTRVDWAQYDSSGNLWLLNAGTSPQLQCKDASGKWHGITLYNENAVLRMPTPGGFVLDNHRPNQKWIAMARNNTGVCMIDDQGTPFMKDSSHVVYRNEWVNQFGQMFKPSSINEMKQDSRGRIWIGTDVGLAYFPADIDYKHSDAIIQPDVMDNNGENPLTSMGINAICEDKQGRLWIGTQSLGIYVLSSDVDEIVAQYTTENSAMPDNSILSLACDEKGKMYVGTAEGLACYDENALPTSDPQSGRDDDDLDMGAMKQWRLHYSYCSPTELERTPQRIFAVSSGALYSVNLKTEEMEYWNKSTGLSGTTIRHIAYDENTKQLIVAYEDGRIDLLDNEGGVRQMPDISLKASSMATTINSISPGSKYIYLSMVFGVVALNARKAEITGTYYIGNNASAVDVKRVIEKGDSLYAFSEDAVYSASLKDDLVNYAYWHKTLLPTAGLTDALLYKDCFYTLQHDSLYSWNNGIWKLMAKEPVEWVHLSEGQMLARRTDNGLWRIDDDGRFVNINSDYRPMDAISCSGNYWMAIEGFGLICQSTQGLQYYEPNGPLSNSGYAMTSAHDQVYVVSGGRWATEYERLFQLSISNGKEWKGYSYWNVYEKTKTISRDAVSVAVDPKEPNHYYVATYGTGVYEFKPDQTVIRYDQNNSSLRPINDRVDADYYTRTDGALMDKNGNFWVLNSTNIGQALHVRTPNGQWKGIALSDQSGNVTFATPGKMISDRRNANMKWFINQRVTPSVCLFDDNGTPTMTGDDRFIRRSIFIDQNGAKLTPEYILCIEQDYSNRLWIGTPSGIIVIPADVDFFKSETCLRIIIPRNDETGFGDYLLGNERINCLAVDGGNRMWIGTDNSGLYLIEDDTITVAHFTVNNSLLPSNSIMSISIMPTTGEVFVGTASGIASYRADASTPQEDMRQAYAFPNPVRPDYGGDISIAGLMENTDVNIIDAGGNLVCKTRSHGGLAVWDGRLPDGRRATAGVYTALCNAVGGQTVVKILVIR